MSDYESNDASDNFLNDDQQYCTFLLERLLFGVQVDRVQEVLRPQPITRVPMAPAGASGLLNLRGQIVTAIDLRSRLDLPRAEDEDALMNVVIRTGVDSVVSLQVDSIDEIVTVNESTFERAPDTLDRNVRQLITGAYKLDNTLLLCLDVDKVVGLVSEKKEGDFRMPDQG
jgi:purine-binding chemotaxis protein CheW